MSTRLLRGDCLDVMKTIIDGSIDMILADLPYGTTQNKWDSVIPLDALWDQYCRIVKTDGAIVLTAQTPFDKLLGVSNLRDLKYEWIWRKNVATGHLNANRAPMKEHENILVFSRGLPTYNPQMATGARYMNRRRPVSDSGSNYGAIKRRDTVNMGSRFPKTVIEVAREIGRHPTQKPVALMEYLIRTYTNEGETVLDNTMGSGTTGVACVNTGRNFIGIELDEGYFKIAEERIADAQEKKRLADAQSELPLAA